VRINDALLLEDDHLTYDPSEASWKVERRFNDFKALHEKVSNISLVAGKMLLSSKRFEGLPALDIPDRQES